MKARKQPVDEITNLHAEWYHRVKIDALRAEGERLRRELRRRGADPSLILQQEQQRRTSDSN